MPSNNDTTEPLTGATLIERWQNNGGHEYLSACPGCGKDVASTALTELVYTFEVCRCGSPEYAHLVETIWHRSCSAARAPEPAPVPEGETND